MAGRFFPTFWVDVKATVWKQLLGVITAVLILIAQIHFGIIGRDVQPRLISILWPYALLTTLLIAYHLLRTPWLISNSHLETIAAHEQTIAERDASIVSLTPPQRTRAQQRDYEQTKEALRVVGEPGLASIRFLRNRGTVKIIGRHASNPRVEPQPPSDIKFATIFHAFPHCEDQGLLHCTRDLGHSEEIYTINPDRKLILEELLYEEKGLSGFTDIRQK